MRKAAAIILFVTAIMNILRGSAYSFIGGAAMGDSVVVADAAVEDTAGTGSATADREDAVPPSFWMIFGVFLLALSGIQIFGGVLLLLSKLRYVIFGMAVLSVVAECVGFVRVGFVFWQLFGLVGGLLAFIGAMGIGKDAAPAAPAT